MGRLNIVCNNTLGLDTDFAKCSCNQLVAAFYLTAVVCVNEGDLEKNNQGEQNKCLGTLLCFGRSNCRHRCPHPFITLDTICFAASSVNAVSLPEAFSRARAYELPDPNSRLLRIMFHNHISFPLASGGLCLFFRQWTENLHNSLRQHLRRFPV